MILNHVEKAMMNNPIRSYIQKNIEANSLLEMGGRMSGGIALEVGCGQGVGVEIILNHFGADRVDAFDLDHRMVTRAQKRLKKYADRVNCFVGDVTEISAQDNYYDAVFDFGIIHHVPNWRKALEEVFRVLKPGGIFYAEEVFDKFILNPVWKFLLDHPLEDRFNQTRFIQGLEACGFHVMRSLHLWQLFGWFVAKKEHFEA